MDLTEHNEVSRPRGERQYHTKRPHRKSRAGCRNCKARKVKCDEARPACRACTLRNENCVYVNSPPVRHSSSRALTVSRRQSPDQDSSQSGLRLLDEPLFMSTDKDATDMKLLWFYTTKTYDSFSASGGPVDVDEILRIRIVQHAFQVPFLMNTVLGLAALHLKHLNQDVSPTKEIAYRARALEGYRRAVEVAKPETYPALLACSLFLCALSTDQFRVDDAKPLFIVDWLMLWRGISLIIKLIKEEGLAESGLAVLFFRPPVDLNQAAQHIPSNLLFMITSLKEDDPDFSSKMVYYNCLRCLGSIYQELARGFSALFTLRVVVFPSFLGSDFVALAQDRRPRALVIIAHFLAFAKLVQGVWWMEGISNKDILHICDLLGEEWRSMLRVPRVAAGLTDRLEIAKLLLDNHAWEPPPNTSSTVEELKWIDNLGRPLQLGRDLVYRLPRREPPPPEPRVGGFVIEDYECKLVEQEALAAEDLMLTPSSSGDQL